MVFSVPACDCHLLIEQFFVPVHRNAQISGTFLWLQSDILKNIEEDKLCLSFHYCNEYIILYTTHTFILSSCSELSHSSAWAKCSTYTVFPNCLYLMLLHFAFKTAHHPELTNVLLSSFLSYSSLLHNNDHKFQLDSLNNLSYTHTNISPEISLKK